MARESYVIRDGKLVPKHLAGPHPLQGKRHGRGPMILRPIEPFRSPIDGTEISCRSHVREHERRHGVVQIGDDPIPPRKPYEPEGVEQDIKEAIEKVEAGHKPIAVDKE